MGTRIGWLVAALAIAACGCADNEAPKVPAVVPVPTTQPTAATLSTATTSAEPTVPAPSCWPGGVSRSGACVACPAPTLIPRAAAQTLVLEEPDADSVRDPRPIRVRPRVLSLLVVEIQQLEALLAATPNRAPDRPTILRRLGASYEELAFAAGRDRQGAEKARAAHSQDGDTAAAAKDEQLRRVRAATETAARKKAIDHYTTLVEEYQGSPSRRFPSAPPVYVGLDEVTYYLGLEIERSGDVAGARKAYFDLIKNAPSSRMIPLAYFAFAELFYAQGGADPTMWALAKAAYEKVAQHPPPGNPAFSFAWYRLGQVATMTSEFQAALSAFKHVVESEAHESQGGSALGSLGRRALVATFVQVGDPTRALAFFRAVPESDALSLANELGDAYLATAHYAEAAKLYLDLLERDTAATDEAACRYHDLAKASALAATGDRRKCPDCPP